LPATGGARTHVRVAMDYDTVAQQLTGGRLDTGDRLTAEQARRMACDAGITPVMFNGASIPLDRAGTPVDHRPDAQSPGGTGSWLCLPAV
jgi:hypothetical protein